ncbi:MAG: outer membrane lipoprotein-sorting protein [Gammaproteobacteria bacterium]|nr:outer membrane lipoprotein-sorting protein [Gammaproteobacteria bacterium]
MFAGAALALVLAVPCPQGHAAPRPSEAGPAAEAAAEVSPQEILERSDRIRFPQYDFQVDVAITTTKASGDPEVREYRLLSKGNTRTLVQTMAPAIDRGQILLMRDRDLWAFLPSVSQPVRLPLSQKLTGQVANGDLARANFVGDYHPKLLRTEEIDGQKMHVLKLTAAERGVTYHRVVYWVNASDYHPHKAEFYTLSNRLMKVCHYTDFKVLGDEIRPTRLIMEDALRQSETSEMVYSNMAPRELPEKVFNKDYLKKLSR